MFSRLSTPDEAFLVSLGFQAGGGSSWRLFHRKGDLLMALPVSLAEKVGVEICTKVGL